jgi:hypothetical protein
VPISSKGQVHDVFNRLIAALTAQAAAQAQAARGVGHRRWNAPDPAVEPLDVPGITAGFDRTTLGANFESLIADGMSPGTIGDAISVKIQGDYVAVMERGYRARHCTPCRLIGMMAARRAGHGNPAGVFGGGVSRHVQDVLKAGQT